MENNGWRYGLVKADHYRPIKEQNLNSAFINYTACYQLGGLNKRKMKELVNVRTNVIFLQNEAENEFNLSGCLEVVLIYTDGKDYQITSKGEMKASHKLTETRLIVTEKMMAELITGLQLHNQKLVAAKGSANSINAMAQYAKNQSEAPK